jgi:hypothetical protein
MSKGQFATTLVIYSCPAASLESVNELASEYGLTLSWAMQELMVGSSCSEVTFKTSSLRFDDLASALARFNALHFELIQTSKESGTTYLFVPGLGLHRGELNASGSLVLTEEKLQSLLDQAAGNHREFTRLLRLSLGQSWEDILEPFRAAKYTDNVVLLNRAG